MNEHSYLVYSIAFEEEMPTTRIDTNATFSGKSVQFSDFPNDIIIIVFDFKKMAKRTPGVG